eukprot:CFRG0007T1
MGIDLLSVVLALLPAMAMAAESLVIENVQTKIDLQSQLVKTAHTITVQNTGDTAVDFFEVNFPTPVKGSYAFQRCVVDKTALILRNVSEMDATRVDSDAQKVVKFKEPLSPGKAATLVVRTVVSHAYLPFPAEIPQHSDQYMKVTFNKYLETPYTVTSQSISISADQIVAVDNRPYKPANGVMSLGPFKEIDLKSTQQQSTTLVVKNNAPFLVAEKMVREIAVSHWTRVKIDDILSLKHMGAKLKGFFSRVDYMRARNSAPAVISNWVTILPAEAADFDYRDEVGNISTSTIRSTLKNHKLTLTPRFPIFGGWKSGYMLNYTLPAENHLSTDGNGNYLFKLPVVPHVYDNFVIDELELRVALPEGASDVTVKNKYGFDDQSIDVKHTYLDILGRPVVVLTKYNVVNDHSGNFEVRYHLDTSETYHQPFLLVGSYFIVFVLLIVYLRSDFRLDRTPEAKKTN